MKHKIAFTTVVPFLLIATSAVAYLSIAHHWNFEISSYAIFLFTAIYTLILERIIPLKKNWNPTKKSVWIELKHFIFSTAIFDALGKMLALSLVLFFQKKFFVINSFWDSLPFLASFIIANLIGEFLPYVYHRVSHRGNKNSIFSIFLWRVHAIHHLPNSLNWFKTNWNHPINMFLNTFFKMTPLLLLGFSKEIIFLVGVTHVVIAYISHANIQTKKSFLDYLIVTPQVHHFHHSKDIKEAKNFGNILPFWDLLFGTYYNRNGAVAKVGVIEDSTTAYPKNNGYIKQLVFPITSFKDCCK